MYESVKAGKIVKEEAGETLSDGTAGGVEDGAVRRVIHSAKRTCQSGCHNCNYYPGALYSSQLSAIHVKIGHPVWSQPSDELQIL